MNEWPHCKLPEGRDKCFHFCFSQFLDKDETLVNFHCMVVCSHICQPKDGFWCHQDRKFTHCALRHTKLSLTVASAPAISHHLPAASHLASHPVTAGHTLRGHTLTCKGTLGSLLLNFWDTLSVPSSQLEERSLLWAVYIPRLAQYDHLGHRGKKCLFFYFLFNLIIENDACPAVCLNMLKIS